MQNDIKRVIAYSTCSQLGYMFFAAGVGAYGAAMFHLFTHAFFKALLFLGAGSVIHAMHHEQDMRYYGGLRKEIPLTFWAMMAGTLAITGVGIVLGRAFGFAGFYSKDAIIESAYASGSELGGFAFFVGVFAALLTSFYSWRLMFLTFFGKPRWAAVRAYPARAARRSSRPARCRGCRPRHPRRATPARTQVRPAPAAIIRTRARGRCWCRSALLSLGAIFAGFVFHERFIEPRRARISGAAAIAFNEHLMHAMHRCAAAG